MDFEMDYACDYSYMQNPRYFLNFHIMRLCLYKQPLWVAAVLNAVIFLVRVMRDASCAVQAPSLHCLNIEFLSPFQLVSTNTMSQGPKVDPGTAMRV